MEASESDEGNGKMKQDVEGDFSFSCIKVPKKCGVYKNSSDLNGTESADDDDFFWLLESEKEIPTMKSLAELIRPEVVRRFGSFPDHLRNILEPRSIRFSGLEASEEITRSRRQPRRLVEPSVLPRSASTRGISSAAITDIMSRLRNLSPHTLNSIAAEGRSLSISTLLAIIQQHQSQLAQQRSIQHLNQHQQQLHSTNQQRLNHQQTLAQHRLSVLQNQLQHPVQQFTTSTSTENPSDQLTHTKSTLPNQSNHSSKNSSYIYNQHLNTSPILTPSLSSSAFPISNLYGKLHSHLVMTRSGINDPLFSESLNAVQSEQLEFQKQGSTAAVGSQLYHLHDRFPNIDLHHIETGMPQQDQTPSLKTLPIQAAHSLRVTSLTPSSSYQPYRCKESTQTNITTPDTRQFSKVSNRYMILLNFRGITL